MKLYEIVIKPRSFWGTIPKGDTLFGRLCWQIVYDYGENKLKEYLKNYEDEPFCIISTAFPKIKIKEKKYYILKTPTIPLRYIYNEIDESEYKKYKKRNLILIESENKIKIDLNSEKLTMKELSEKYFNGEYVIKNFKYTHNTINRFTNTTGTDIFSPYDVEYFVYNDKIELSIFVLINDNTINKDELEKIFKNIGKIGFGKDQSIGFGKFDLESINEISITNENTNYQYALSPFIPKDENDNIFYTPFVRYGKHGTPLSKEQVSIKKPILMCDDGAVINKGDIKNYYGKAILKVSHIKEETVHQGYTIVIPIKNLIGK